MKGDRATGCPQCGARGVAGKEGCNKVFQEVVGREFGRPELFHVHRVTVDAYSLQHPDQYMKSAKSAVAHLAGMCWTMEGSGDPSVSYALSRFLDGNPEFQRPTPVPTPGHRGAMNIVDIHSAPDSNDHVGLVQEWARMVWDAWEIHHDLARKWVEAARAKGRPGKGR